MTASDLVELAGRDLEQIIVDVLDTFHDGQREKKARAIASALRERIPLPGVEGREDTGPGTSPSSAVYAPLPVRPESAAPTWMFIVMATSGEWSDRREWPVCGVWDEDAAQAKAEELQARVAAAKALCGRSPARGAPDADWTRFWRLEEAARKSIEDIGGSDLDISFFTYKVEIAHPPEDASLSDRQGSVAYTSEGNPATDDLNSTSIPSGGDALKEALDVMGQAVQQAADWFYEYEALHEAKGTPDALAKAATNANRAEWLHHMKDKAEALALSQQQSSRGTGE